MPGRDRERPDAVGRVLIVTAGRARGSLAAARALSGDGWVVGVGTPDGGGMVGTSRACSRTHRVPRPRGDGRAFVGGLRHALADGAYDVVFGGGDDWMAALSTYRDEIPARVAHPAADVVSAALDKVELTERARAVGMQAPRTAPASDALLDAWRGPVVVKCRAHWTPGQVQQHRVEARLFPDAESARARVERVRRAGLEPVVQQSVDGRLGALVGLFHGGRLHGRVQQVSPRLWPTPTGVSCRAETVPVDEALAAKAEQLLDGLGWSGLVELQFLTDDSGAPHLIDLNGRFYGSMGLANAARPGLADAWARLALGREVPELGDAETGVRFAWTAGDLRRAAAERRGGLLVDVAGTLGWARRARKSVWSLTDPGPTWHLVTARLRQPHLEPVAATVPRQEAHALSRDTVA